MVNRSLLGSQMPVFARRCLIFIGLFTPFAYIFSQVVALNWPWGVLEESDDFHSQSVIRSGETRLNKHLGCQ